MYGTYDTDANTDDSDSDTYDDADADEGVMSCCVDLILVREESRLVVYDRGTWKQ